MPLSPVLKEDLEKVRTLDRRRIRATAANDLDVLAPLLDDDLVYITSSGDIYNKKEYLTALRTSRLSYEEDFEVEETEYRVLNGFIILLGLMLGHARLDGEQQVFHCSCLSAWRKEAGQWRMVAWQSSSGCGKTARRETQSLQISD